MRVHPRQDSCIRCRFLSDAPTVTANGTYLPYGRLQRIYRWCILDPALACTPLAGPSTTMAAWTVDHRTRCRRRIPRYVVLKLLSRTVWGPHRSGSRGQAGEVYEVGFHKSLAQSMSPVRWTRDRRPDASSARDVVLMELVELEREGDEVSALGGTPARGAPQRSRVRFAATRWMARRDVFAAASRRAVAVSRGPSSLWATPTQARTPGWCGPTTAATCASTSTAAPGAGVMQAADLTAGPVPGIADDSAVVFVSCVLEYVEDVARRRWPRSGGSPGPTTTSSS
jgi:hypothetical protein